MMPGAVNEMGWTAESHWKAWIIYRNAPLRWGMPVDEWGAHAPISAVEERKMDMRKEN